MSLIHISVWIEFTTMERSDTVKTIQMTIDETLVSVDALVRELGTSSVRVDP